MEKTVKNEAEMGAFAREVVLRFSGLLEERKNALVFALYGELGSGKTTFVKSAAEELGVKEPVVSPTFVIERVYKLKHPQFTRFIHIDAYRFKNENELLTLGWSEVSANPLNIIFLEWAEKVEALLPKDAVKIYFEGVDEETRKVKTRI